MVCNNCFAAAETLVYNVCIVLLSISLFLLLLFSVLDLLHTLCLFHPFLYLFSPLVHLRVCRSAMCKDMTINFPVV